MSSIGAKLAVVEFSEGLKWGIRVPLKVALWTGDAVSFVVLGAVELMRGKKARSNVEGSMSRMLDRRITKELAR